MKEQRTEFGTFAQLSGMMFLQFAIWGAWAVLMRRAHAKSRIQW